MARQRGLGVTPLGFVRRLPVASNRCPATRFQVTRWLHAVLAVALALPAVWWLTTAPFFRTHDGDQHRWRMWEYWQLWQSGDVPVRWGPDLSYGFGSPLFTYYNPLTYLLGGLAQSWGLDSASAAKLVSGFSLLLGAFGMYALAAEWCRGEPRARWAALLASTAYLYAPYVLVNVYQRGALAEALALGIAPWLLWSEGRCLRRGDLPSCLALALSTAAIILAHNLTALIFAAIAATTLAFWLAARCGDWAARARTARYVMAAVALGVSLAAFYWLPVLGQLGDVQAHRDSGGQSTPVFREHLVSPLELVQARLVHDYRLEFTREKPSVPHLGLTQVAAIAAGVVFAASRWRRGRRAEMLVPGGVAVSLFMASSWSRWIWEGVPALAFFQFPWRFFGAIAVLGALVTGGLGTMRRGSAVAVMLGLALVASGVWVFTVPQPWQPNWDAPSSLREFERQTKQLGLTTFDEFLPTWVQRSRDTLFEPADRRTARVDRPALEVHLLGAQPTQWQADVTAVEQSPLVFDVFYFPTWRATIDGQPVPLYPSGPLGLLAVDVPPGRHDLHISLEASSLERVATGLSILAGLVLAGLLVKLWLGARPRRRLASSLVAAIGLGAASSFLLAPMYPSTAATYVVVPAEAAPPGPARLLGARLDQSRLSTTGQLDVALLVLVPGAPERGEPLLRVRLTDPDGRIAAESVHTVGQGLRPATMWQPNLILTDRFEWWLPARSSGGTYTLHAGFAGGPLSPLALFELPALRGAPPSALVPPSASDWQALKWGDDLVLDNVEWRLERAASGAATEDVDAAGMVLSGDFSWERLSSRSTTYEAALRVVDSRGEIWSETTVPVSLALDEARSRQPIRLVLESGLLPGERYRVELRVRDADGEWLSVASQDKTAGSAVLWEHEPRLDCNCLPSSASTIGSDSMSPGEGIRALGYERRVVGRAVDVVVYWQALGVPTRSYSSFIHILDREGQLVDQLDGVPYSGTRPTNTWREGEVVPFAARLRLPANSNGGPFRVRAGFYEVEGLQPLVLADGREYLSLGLVERDQPGRAPVAGQVTSLEEGIRFLGHRFERVDGEGVATLYWQASRQILGDYSVFVHVLDASGQIVAQADGPPELGERKTADWPPGEIVLDPHRFALPTDRPLWLRVGLYSLADGRRLHTEHGGDVVELGQIQ